MKTLKMVNGVSYMCPPVFGPERVLLKGEQVEVSDDHAKVLLDDKYTDALNNEHVYFKEVAGAEVEEVAPAPRRRKPAAQ